MAFSLTGVLLRSGRLVLRVGAQAVPVGGVSVLSWPAAGGLILSWIESVLVLGATTLLLSLSLSLALRASHARARECRGSRRPRGRRHPPARRAARPGRRAVGFFGVLGAVFLGKLLLLFGLFAGVKTFFEIGAVLERQPVKL